MAQAGKHFDRKMLPLSFSIHSVSYTEGAPTDRKHSHLPRSVSLLIAQRHDEERARGQNRRDEREPPVKGVALQIIA
jgi:hypothetical protein